MKIRVLVACEESQVVCKAFREKGHEAYSCDLVPTRGGYPEWHIQKDVFEVIDHPHRHGNQPYFSLDGKTWKWDAMVAFVPCDHLAVSGARWFAEKRADGRQRAAIEFFLSIWESEIPNICIENPIGIMSGKREYLHRAEFRAGKLVYVGTP